MRVFIMEDKSRVRWRDSFHKTVSMRVLIAHFHPTNDSGSAFSPDKGPFSVLKVATFSLYLRELFTWISLRHLSLISIYKLLVFYFITIQLFQYTFTYCLDDTFGGKYSAAQHLHC